MIYYKDGAKMMRPVLSREEYLQLRNSGEQKQLVQRIRNGERDLKHRLVQPNRAVFKLIFQIPMMKHQ